MNGVANKASDDTVARVRAAVDALGYRPQSAGRALRQRESRIVGVLAANLANPAMAAAAASIEHALRAGGYVMALCDTHEDPAIQDEYLAEMEAQLACCIVLLVAIESPRLDQLRAAGRPLIFVNRRDPGGGAAPFIGIDDYAAGGAIAEHCLSRPELGPFGLIHASLAHSAGARRAAGFLDRMGEAGFTAAAIPRATAAGPSHLEIGYGAMAALLAREPRPRCLVCLSDLLAYGAYRRLREAGLDLPGDATLISFDDNPLNGWIAPWLSAIRIPYPQFGPAVVETLQELLGEGRAQSRLLPHQLVLRPES
jgi:LacI family transcriptional regulator